MSRRSWLCGYCGFLVGAGRFRRPWPCTPPNRPAPRLRAPPGGHAPPCDHTPSLKVFAQALALVEDQYAEPKTTKDLVYGAIQGAVGTLDAHSSFMTPEDLRELQIETKGKFSGIGIEIAMKDHGPDGGLPHRRHPRIPDGNSAGRPDRQDQRHSPPKI